MRKKALFSLGIGFIVSVCIAFLLGSVIRSGALFQLDPDELAHAHVSYLLLHGFKPYTEFILIYTPVFHFLIAPILLLGGFTIEGVESIRWLMIVFFLARVLVSFFLVRRLFGTRIAVVFMFIFLSDPFTVFSAMQIRPDNVMMLSFTAGLFVLLQGLKAKRRGYFFWSGFFMALSCLILIKIFPSILVVFIVLFWYTVREKKVAFFTPFAIGFCIPMLTFALYAAGNGTLRPMLEQISTYAIGINNGIAYPVPISHFYRLNDPSLFDFYGAGNTLVVLEYLLPLFALIGIGFALRRFKNVMTIILVGAVITQSISLLLVHSVFIQYFLPVSWLWALFSAVGAVELIRVAKPLRIVFAACAGILFFNTIQTNVIRSRAQTGNVEIWLENMWRQIPQNETVYPNIVFRPIAYPMVYGYYLHDTPRFLRNKLPGLIATLEQNKVRFILKTYEWIALPAEFPAYVEDAYEPAGVNVFRKKAPP